MFNFPNTPALGDSFQPVGGPAYQWDGQKWVMSGSPITWTPAYAMRNRICNPAFQISQENGRTSLTTFSSYPADQWAFGGNGPTGMSCASVDGNPDFVRMWSGGNPTSPAAGNHAYFQQKIEGIRLVDFGWGATGALPITIRFKARAANASLPLPIIFSVTVQNGATNRSFVRNFTLTSTNWQDFTTTIPGDTTGTWATDNTMGMVIFFTTMCGSTYITAPGAWTAGNFIAGTGIGNMFTVASTGIDFANVGLYLDASGSGLPPAWEMPDEAAELAACMRYWEKQNVVGTTWCGNSTSGIGYTAVGRWLAAKRIAPTVTGTSTVASGFPATTGSLTAPDISVFYEARTANAAVNGAQYSSNITGNARM
jgi:hypothetical protein